MTDKREHRGGSALTEEILDGNDPHTKPDVSFNDHILKVVENVGSMTGTIDSLTSSGLSFDDISDLSDGFRNPIARLIDNQLLDMSDKDRHKIVNRQATSMFQEKADGQVNNNIGLIRSAKMRYLASLNAYNPLFKGGSGQSVPEPGRAKETPDHATNPMGDDRERRAFVVGESRQNL